jgi:adenylyltransferase/sulfurtransferase
MQLPKLNGVRTRYRRKIETMPTNTKLHSDWIITVDELKECLSSVTLVDVREPEEHANSYIEGCKLIPLGEIQLRVEQELDKKAQIVLYCAHGVRSLYALAAMERLGFENLRSLEGGIVAWEEQHGPTRSPG